MYTCICIYVCVRIYMYIYIVFKSNSVRYFKRMNFVIYKAMYMNLEDLKTGTERQLLHDLTYTQNLKKSIL